MDGYVGVNRLVALERMGLPPLAGLWLPMMHSAVYSLAHYPFRYLTGRVGLEVCEDLHRSHCALHVNEAVSIDPATPSEDHQSRDEDPSKTYFTPTVHIRNWQKPWLTVRPGINFGGTS